MKTLFSGMLFVAFSFFVLPIQAQETLPDQIQNYFQSIQKEFPTEKVYLHLDKHTYTLGDDVWFSAYLLAGSSQIPSPLSSTLYVDIFDGSGLLLEQRKVKIEQGRGAGDFKIPRFGKTGKYQVKAYTAWMRNFGEEYFLTTSFVVVDGAGGSFLPKVNFSEISTSTGKVKYQVEIDAVSSSGNPLSNQPLEIRALAGETELYKQSLALNAQGQASFSFTIPEKDNPSQSLEMTYYENGDYPVTQTIRLPYALSLADVQFLPEGGHMVIGKKSNVAFRAVDPDGTPLDIQGTIEGQPFATRFGGMGKVELTPSKSDYSAVITNPKTGETRTVSLPKADSEGLVVQVVNNPGAAFITVFVQGQYDPNSLLLVSQTRGVINYMIQGALANGVWGVRIPKENLISGINHITVLSTEGKPLLERLIFVQKDDFLKLELANSGPLSPRGKVALDFTGTFNNQPAKGSFSISVTDADQVSDESDEYGTIFSSLLLTSDLRGKIHQPGIYFKDQEAETLELLDLVMLTHGWRRFTWDDVLANKLPEIANFIERGINIEGQITEQQETKKGLGGGKVSAVIGDGIEIISSEYGPNGRFILRELDYQDSVTVTITAEDSRARNFVDVSIIKPEAVFTQINGVYPTQIQWPAALAESFEARNLLQRLNEDQDILDLEGVTVEAKTIQKEEEEVRKIYGTGDVTINPDKIPGNVAYTNVFQLIQGRVSGVQVFVSGLDVQVQIRGVGSVNSGTGPLYLLDNFPVDASTLLQINPRDVSSVDVFKDPARAAIFGSQGANGVIAVYTKTGAGISNVSVGGTLVTQYGGYDSPREFYSPKYDEKSNANATTDSRATLYWNPAVNTDANGKAQIQFFNSDTAKRQLIILEGMDAEGRLGRTVKIIQ
ncbi:TonB-dependent receptor plug domain-containing protein [Algoriphagus litoralis]|uniref:TonB-dependent receptor plug domain-containing protein n=1 Tax=Algoriphagus litoralis TaxID=2202829 RepID=UPI000DB94743|nr:TonB-dependent receptor plug domain-containing protein [Algoriphagus litoralis]